MYSDKAYLWFSTQPNPIVSIVNTKNNTAFFLFHLIRTDKSVLFDFTIALEIKKNRCWIARADLRVFLSYLKFCNYNPFSSRRESLCFQLKKQFDICCFYKYLMQSNTENNNIDTDYLGYVVLLKWWR